MQFTARETKLIERLRKEELRWHRTRWMLLVMVVLILAMEGLLSARFLAMTHATVQPAEDQAKDMPPSFQTFSILRAGQEMTFAFALFYPQLILGVGVAGWTVGLLIRDWHGRGQQMLLLRLLDAQQKDDHAA